MNFTLLKEKLKNINAKTTLLLSILFLAIVVYIFSGVQKKQEIKKQEFEELKNIAMKFKMGNENYSDAKNITTKLNNILKGIGIQNGIITNENKIITLDIPQINDDKLQKFLNSILNEKFNILKLEIKKDKLTLTIGIV